ncbi:peptidoglycan D,D-transpeptidase FtsI family protein [Paenibacillus contaminans]|uniref:Penicillin-binding protein 2 n=1 Tax=Paenibacillus contaminans TaxID=450362 RepID=A0A329MGQ8_9BACL|nr:penicillin-binding transpeptidase domain-containing protein [Paenibacillus contaminans]RAV19085.1 penicillin-binding protein 2 [Paenibacillus contaminans]
MTFRLNLFFFSVFFLFSVLLVRLAYLQFVEGEDLKASETFIDYKPTPIAPIRGNIYDSNGHPIAVSKPVQSLYFRVEVGQSDDDIIEIAYGLEGIFEEHGKAGQETLTAADILKRMDVGINLDKSKAKNPSFYNVPRRIKTDLSKDEAAVITEHRDELQGIEIVEESIRQYDPQSIAAQLVGYLKRFNAAREKQNGLAYYKEQPKGEYMDTEDVGFDGIELMYQEQLRGKKGLKTYPVNAINKIIGIPEIAPPTRGNNIYLTINKDVQLVAEQAITDQIQLLQQKDYGLGKGMAARSGYAVAMEVDTGRVVAMASMPDYDTNIWTGSSIPVEAYNKIRQFVNNGTIRTSYPDYPEKEMNAHTNSLVFLGSTIKPLTVLIGLNERLFGLRETYYDPGYYVFGADNSRIINSDGYANGSLNATSAIQKSSNTFMSAMIGVPLWNKYGREKGTAMQVWADYLAKFGLGVSTGSGMPGEYNGANDFFANAKQSSIMSAMVYASWGQNERYTTLQLAQFAATLASRGKRIKPQFVEKIVDPNNNTVQQLEPVVLDEVKFASEHWDAVIAGMKSSAEGIDTLPYNVARKTGTSTQDVSNGKSKVDNAVLIAFAPAEKPKLAVAVVVPEGGFGKYGAAPIAAKIFEAYDKAVGGLSGAVK